MFSGLKRARRTILFCAVPGSFEKNGSKMVAELRTKLSARRAAMVR
jgi:hypothetical protein